MHVCNTDRYGAQVHAIARLRRAPVPSHTRLQGAIHFKGGLHAGKFVACAEGIDPQLRPADATKIPDLGPPVRRADADEPFAPITLGCVGYSSRVGPLFTGGACCCQITPCADGSRVKLYCARRCWCQFGLGERVCVQ